MRYRTCVLGAALLSGGAACSPRAPAAAPVARTAAPFRVAVLAEGYPEGRTSEARFNQRIDRIQRAADDSFPAPIEMIPVFCPSEHDGVPYGEAAPDDTPFRTVYNGRRSDSWVTTADDTYARIRQALADQGLANVTHALVIMHVPTHVADKGMCDWAMNAAFIGEDADDDVAMHEFGHLLGLLMDENGIGCQGALYRNDRNCSPSPDLAAAPWAGLLRTPPVEGCNGCQTGYWRPARYCRMGQDPTRPFCAVCTHILREEGDKWDAGGAGPASLVVGRVNRSGMLLLHRTESTAPRPVDGERQVLNSDFVAVVRGAGGADDVRWIGGLAGDPFLRRGLLADGGHALQRRRDGDFALQVPSDRLDTGSKLELYRLPEDFFNGKVRRLEDARRLLAGGSLAPIGGVPLPAPSSAGRAADAPRKA